MFLTQADLVAQVREETSRNPSPAATLYADARIRRTLVRAFNHVYKTRFWKVHCTTVSMTLESDTGRATEDLSFIRDYTDIGACFHPNTPHPIPELPHTLNPSRIGSGTTPLYRSPYNAHYEQSTPNEQPLPTTNNNIIQFYPATTAGVITAHVRLHPGDFASQDTHVVPFDADALVFWTVAHLNARREDATYQWYIGQYADRINTLVDAENALPMPVNTGDPSAHIPDEWYPT